MTFGMTLVFGYVLQGAVRNLSLVFYFMLFKSWSHERFTELHYSIAESIVIFLVVTIPIGSLHLLLNKRMYSCLLKVSPPHLQPLDIFPQL